VRFGLDLDGVLYNWDSVVRFLMKDFFGYDLKPAEFWDGIEAQVKPEHWKWLWKEGLEKHGLFRHGNVYKGGIEFVKKLAKLVDVVIITSRPERAAQDTIEWLGFHRIPTTEIHILGGGLSKGKTKSDVKCDFYLDDSPKNVVDLFENTDALVMLMDRPWNKDVTDKIVRVKSWEDVLRNVKMYV
jgi:uncharacterized HAD superfamily protein